MSLNEEVVNASRQFYAALNRMVNGDGKALSEIWQQSPIVTALHPIGGRHVGWDAVRDSFDEVAKISSDAKIDIEDQIIHVDGDIAYELGVEKGHASLAGHRVDFNHRVTNVYRKHNGSWKIVHHHTDVAPSMLEALQLL